MLRVQLCSYLLSKGLGMHCHDYIPCWDFDLREILDSSLDLFQLKCIESVSCLLIEELVQLLMYLLFHHVNFVLSLTS